MMSNLNAIKPIRPIIFWMVALAAVLGLLFGFSFVGQPVGLFVPFFAFFLLLSLSLLAQRQASVRWKKNTWDVLKFLHLDNLVELASRLVVSGIAAWLILGGFSYALRQNESEAQVKPETLPEPGWLGMIEVAVVLGSVDTLFAAFVAVQFR